MLGILLSRKSHTAGSFYFNKQATKKKKKKYMKETSGKHIIICSIAPPAHDHRRQSSVLKGSESFTYHMFKIMQSMNITSSSNSGILSFLDLARFFSPKVAPKHMN